MSDLRAEISRAIVETVERTIWVNGEEPSSDEIGEAVSLAAIDVIASLGNGIQEIPQVSLGSRSTFRLQQSRRPNGQRHVTSRGE